MPALDQYDPAHSAGSSTRVSAEGIQATSPPLVLHPRTPHFVPYFARHPSDVENHKQVASHKAPSVSESERERIEREDAVSAVSPRGEVARSPLEEVFIEKEKEDPFLVVWDENDKANPKTWSKAYRWFLTFASSLLILNASFASSAPSGVALPIAVEFGLSQIETTLAISLFITGYCVGPLAWGPLSEQYGRRPMFIIAFFFYTILQVACAVAPNGVALLVLRFLSGCFAACPLTNSGAILADIWDNDTRGTAMSIFVISPFAGPALGPIVGGYVEVAGISWRWVFWILAIFSGLCFVLAVFFIPETYAPVLLVKKAQAIRKETGDERFTAALEMQNTHWRVRLQTVLGRPFKVMFLEPLLLVLSLYMSYVYGILYLLFTAYPVIFIKGHGLNQGENGLTFLPIFIGGICGVIFYIVWFAPQYKKECEKYAPFPPPPETRLSMSLYGGPLFIAGIFWLGWTSYPSISVWAPLMAGFPIGVSIIFLFLSLSNYMIDAYLVVAASVLASSTVIRSLFGAGFPLFGNQMYTALNPRIASTVLGAAALIVVPVPFLLIKWGPALRKKSRYAMDQPRPMHGPRDDQATKDIERGKGPSETAKGETSEQAKNTIKT